MAKLSYSKLGIKPIYDIININYNDQIIEVKKYISIKEKLELITNVINLSADANNFSNPAKEELYTALEIIKFYTNITFTEKQEEDPVKLYDSFKSSGLLDTIIQTIPEEEYQDIRTYIHSSIHSVYTYRNSLMGILDIVQNDYSNMDLDAEAIREKLGGNHENIEFLRSVMKNLG